ncbi:MAG: hypothetical protein ACF8R7_03830 [Phycisphaerales bacterium JB039]
MERADASLTSFLAANDASCPSCGHGLRGVTLSRCRECGMPLDLELVREGPERAQRRASEMEPVYPDPGVLGFGIGVLAMILALIGALTALIGWLS